MKRGFFGPRSNLSRTVSSVLSAKTDSFANLVKLAGLNPAEAFKFANLSGIDFSDEDLSGFDFTGANLTDCKFDRALITNTVFDSGLAYILYKDYGIKLPQNLCIEFDEIYSSFPIRDAPRTSEDIYTLFIKTYVDQEHPRFHLIRHETKKLRSEKGSREFVGKITDMGDEVEVVGVGTGPIDGFIDAMSRYLNEEWSVNDYGEHAVQVGDQAAAMAYVELNYNTGKLYGVGRNTNIVTASLEAILSGINREH